MPGAGLSESWVYDNADRPISRSGTMGEATTYDLRRKRTAVAGTLDMATGAAFEVVAAYDAFGHLVATSTQASASTPPTNTSRTGLATATSGSGTGGRRSRCQRPQNWQTSLLRGSRRRP